MARSPALARLDELTRIARTRMASADPWLTTAMGGAEIDFMTPEERAERHQILLGLPTAAEERAAARLAIQARIQARRNGRRHV